MRIDRPKSSSPSTSSLCTLRFWYQSSFGRICCLLVGCILVFAVLVLQSSNDPYASAAAVNKSSAANTKTSSTSPENENARPTKSKTSSESTLSTASTARTSSSLSTGRGGGGAAVEPLASRVRFVVNKTKSTSSSSIVMSNAQVESNDKKDKSKNAKAKKEKVKKIPLCRRWQIKLGQWLPAMNLTRPPYKTTVEHLRCYPSDEYKTSPWKHSYKWIPDAAFVKECVFDDYSPTDFCALLPRATVAIVGDSLSWEHYRSLVSLHNVQTHQGYQQQSYELKMNIQQSLCDDGLTTVVYRRDDYLQNLTGMLKQNFPQVLILNRGAHYVEDDELRNDIRALAVQVKAWLFECEQRYQIECHFFWRTSVPGHIGCNETKSKDKSKFAAVARSGPNNNLDEMQAWVENPKNYNDISIEYHWHDFRRQNDLILKEFKKADLVNFQVIDAYHLNILRPDEHRIHQNGDCLHSCYPGKMDVYNQLLLHFLKMQRSSNDVNRLQRLADKRKWPTNVVATKYEPERTQQARQVRLAREAAAAAKEEQAESKNRGDNTDDDEQETDDEKNDEEE